MQCPTPRLIRKTLRGFSEPVYMSVPCGKCEVCRNRNKREWLLRLIAEDSSCPNGVFVTLTYDELNVPLVDDYIGTPETRKFIQDYLSDHRREFIDKDLEEQLKHKNTHIIDNDMQREAAHRYRMSQAKIDLHQAKNIAYSMSHPFTRGSLDKSAIPKFIKRLRRYIEYEGYDNKIKYYFCGEYGDTTFRPHYHGEIFGLPIGKEAYFVQKAWPFGFVTLGVPNIHRLAYLVKYMLKQSLNSGLKNYHFAAQQKAFMSEGLGLGLLTPRLVHRISQQLENYVRTGKKPPDLYTFQYDRQLYNFPRYLRQKIMERLPQELQDAVKLLNCKEAMLEQDEIPDWWIEHGYVCVDHAFNVNSDQLFSKNYKMTDERKREVFAICSKYHPKKSKL